MKKYFVLFSLMIMLSGCEGESSIEKKPSSFPTENPYTMTSAFVEKGMQRFEKSCAICHGRPGTGDGIAAEALKKLPPSYHTEKLRKASDKYLFKAITNGPGVMPAFGESLSDEEIWAIVAYIRTLQGRNL